MKVAGLTTRLRCDSCDATTLLHLETTPRSLGGGEYDLVMARLFGESHRGPFVAGGSR